MKVTLFALALLAVPARAGSISIPCPNGVAPGRADSAVYAGFALDELVTLLCEKLTPENGDSTAVVNALSTVSVDTAAPAPTVESNPKP